MTTAVRRSRQMSAVTALGLPAWSTGPRRSEEFLPAVVEAGYEGVQVFLPGQARDARAAGLADASGIAPARTCSDVDAVLGMWADGGASSVTLHLGTGFETADEATALVEHTLGASERHAVPVLVETHRGTLFQDPARALALVERFPELRFTADLSHWYTGVEMVYGDLEAKFEALGPVFDRCRMIHGRISDPGCIQVVVADDDDSDHVEHFRRMWSAVLAGCRRAGVTELPFVVELLPAAAHYARTVDRGEGPEEEADRWKQADRLWQIFEALEVTE